MRERYDVSNPEWTLSILILLCSVLDCHKVLVSVPLITISALDSEEVLKRCSARFTMCVHACKGRNKKLLGPVKCNYYYFLL